LSHTEGRYSINNLAHQRALFYPPAPSRRGLQQMKPDSHQQRRSPSGGPIAGVVLAGGRGHRMGDVDKPLLELGGRCLVDHVVALALPQVDALVISANRNLDQYRERQLPVLTDHIDDFAGPLAGIAAAMQWALQHDFPLLACFPGDVPRFPADLISRLQATLQADRSEVSWLCNDGQWQPLFSLWSTHLYEPLQQALYAGVYSPMQFIRGRQHALLTLDGCPAGDFDNLNSPDDLARARENLQ